MRIVDHANRERASSDPLKVGGHQASSASMVSMMTALWFWDLEAEDRVSVKPHASPVLHAISYLLGRLEEPQLRTLREFGGLQAYPSRTKDPFPVDYSTGSVGLGAAAPLFGALAGRYVEAHFGRRGRRGRFISLLGDAELDEGNVWEAILDPATQGLGEAVWLVDVNRQSLDRVVPVIKAGGLQRGFESAGWNVVELKYGTRLREAFDRDGGAVLRRRIDEMPNQEYQSLFGEDERTVTEALERTLSLGERWKLRSALEPYRGGVGELIRDLGGHDLSDLCGALADTHGRSDRPTVIFAYTIKGHRLPIAGTAAQPLRPAHRRADRRAAPRPADRSGSRVGVLRRRRAGRRAVRRGRRPAGPAAPPGRPSGADRRAVGRPAAARRVHTGGVRARAHRPRPRARGGRADRDHGAGRQRVDQPRRMDQPGGRVRARRRARRRGRRGGAALAGRAVGPARRARHLRDEPVPAAVAAGPDRGADGRAAAAGGDGLRPVRLPRPGRADLRALLRCAVRAGGHALGDQPVPRGRRPPVDDHAVDRAGAARHHLRRARLRRRGRLAAARRPGAGGAPRTVALSAAVDEADRPAAVRGADRAAGRRGRPRATWSRAPTGCAARPTPT